MTFRVRSAWRPHVLRAVLAALLPILASTACGDDDPGPVGETLTVEGVFLDPHGNPLAGAPVTMYVSDTLLGETIEFRTVSTNASGAYSTEFSWSPGKFPVDVRLTAMPPWGSGMSAAFDEGRVTLPPGRTAATGSFNLQAVQVEEAVNNIVPASFAQGALLGQYHGQSVSPHLYGVIVYLDLDITSTAGSVSGRFDIDYNATTAAPDGALLGAVLLDTLRLELTGDSVPDQPRTRASLKAIATSSTADTLIATPDPCSADGCWLYLAPIRLVRTH